MRVISITKVIFEGETSRFALGAASDTRESFGSVAPTAEAGDVMILAEVLIDL